MWWLMGAWNSQGLLWCAAIMNSKYDIAQKAMNERNYKVRYNRKPE